MIPQAVIQSWAAERPWPTLSAVEQDLILARLIVELARHPLLGDELVFRGGTCLHQLVLDRPRRYSEDLDFVRRTHSPVGPLLDAIRDVAAQVGLEVVGTNVSAHPKVRLRTGSETEPGARLRIKIEINTHETSPALPTVRLPFTVSSTWFTGEADVQTFAPEELIATKIRALYQRKKGRDLFDMWLALTEMGITGPSIVSAFAAIPAGRHLGRSVGGEPASEARGSGVPDRSQCAGRRVAGRLRHRRGSGPHHCASNQSDLRTNGRLRARSTLGLRFVRPEGPATHAPALRRTLHVIDQHIQARCQTRPETHLHRPRHIHKSTQPRIARTGGAAASGRRRSRCAVVRCTGRPRSVPDARWPWRTSARPRPSSPDR